MESQQRMPEAFAATRQRLSEGQELEPEMYERVALQLALMEDLGERLLARRAEYRQRDAVDHEATQQVDEDITRLVEARLHSNQLTRHDKLLGEGILATPGLPASRVVWLLDAVDGTKAYVDPEAPPDFGSALLIADTANRLIVASLYLMPARDRVYCSIGRHAWRNGEPLPSLPGTPRGPAPREAILRWPRKKEQVPPEIRTLYSQAEQKFQEAGYMLQSGQPLTAADILSLAEGYGPQQFLYYGKPWDWLIASAIAYAAGAKVTLYGSGKDVFPLDVDLLRCAERVLCLVEREQSGP